MDWGTGSYELFAVDLEPAAVTTLDALALPDGARLADVACGNGNLALAAARRGARVSGLDLSERLVGAARERLAAEGLEAEWEVGDAEQLPFPDASFDAAASVFGIIFAPDARRAAAELARVTRPGGQIAITAWLPKGGIGESMKLSREVAAEFSPPAADAVLPPDWGDCGALEEFLGPTVEISEHEIHFRAPSAKHWVDRMREHHPAWLQMQKVIPAERFDQLCSEVRAILEAHNEDPQALLAPSPYVLIRADAAG